MAEGYIYIGTEFLGKVTEVEPDAQAVMVAVF